MQVRTDISRYDIFKFNLFFLPRTKANFIFIAVFAACIFAYSLITEHPNSLGDIVVAAIISILAGIAGLLAGFAVSILFILNSSTEKNGVLGKHTYIISSEGLRESTCANEGLQKWNGVQTVGKSPNFKFIRITSYMFHLIPRRAFCSQQEFESFYVMALNLWQTGQVVQAHNPD